MVPWEDEKFQRKVDHEFDFWNSGGAISTSQCTKLWLLSSYNVTPQSFISSLQFYKEIFWNWTSYSFVHSDAEIEAPEFQKLNSLVQQAETNQIDEWVWMN